MSGDVPEPYLLGGAYFRTCVECGSRPQEWCVNPISGEPKTKCPCVARTRDEGDE